MRRVAFLFVVVFGSIFIMNCRLDPDRKEAWTLGPVAIEGYGEYRVAVLNSLSCELQIYGRDRFELLETIVLPCRATGLAVQGDTAYVTTEEPAGRVLVYDLASGSQQREISVGHTPMSPVVIDDGNLLCVACRFDNDVAFVELATGKVDKVKVIREPVALVAIESSQRLYVANHLPEVRPFDDDDNPLIAAEVSVIDVPSRTVRTHIPLPNGSHSLRGMALSPDNSTVVVTHIKSNFIPPPLELKRGRMNLNAISLLDVTTDQLLDTVSLDDPNAGAANPWAVAFSESGLDLYVTHAGMHELSIIDFPALLETSRSRQGGTRVFGHRYDDQITPIRKRIPLGIDGPRCLYVFGGMAVVGGYFSDSLARVIGQGRDTNVISLVGGGCQSPSRLGECYFNDASLCFENWQSCASCHPDGRRDVMYWDLSNDGLGTFKDTKSLLMATRTPPVMWRGVRADALTAIRSGIHHIQFAQPQPGQAKAIHAYLDAMPVTPSPFLDPQTLEASQAEERSCNKCHVPGISRGTLTPSARRGKAIFEGKGGCMKCHPHPLFTNLQKVDPGLGSGVLYDVPSLVEVWRTAPYLHNGDALTIREAITDYNWQQKRGNTKDLTESELTDLITYVKSL